MTGPDDGVISYPTEAMKFEGGDMGVVYKPDSLLLAMCGCRKPGCGTFS